MDFKEKPTADHPRLALPVPSHTQLTRQPRGTPGSPSQRSGIWEKVRHLLWAPFYIHFNYLLWKYS